MTQESVLTNEKDIQSEFQKLNSLFNEEIYTRTTVDTVSVNKFRTYDDLIQHYSSLERLDEAYQVVREHLDSHPESISARYILGIVSLIQQKIEDFVHLKSLLEQLRLSGKWSVVEYVSDQILQYGEQRIALKAKAESLEKQNKQKELKVVLEKLAKNDRKKPGNSKKIWFNHP